MMIIAFPTKVNFFVFIIISNWRISARFTLKVKKNRIILYKIILNLKKIHEHIITNSLSSTFTTFTL